MKLNVCFFCNKICHCPYLITELENNQIESFKICPECASQYLKEEKTNDMTDLTKIETALDLFNYVTKIIGGMHQPVSNPCSCGMTIDKFEDMGKLGCPKCYDHFEEIRTSLVSFHGSQKHIGKKPLNRFSSKEEKLKYLKLKYAKALELEEYEEAALIMDEIKNL